MVISTDLSTIDSKRQIKQTRRADRDRIMDTESILMVCRWRSNWGYVWRGEGIKKYKLVVTE